MQLRLAVVAISLTLTPACGSPCDGVDCTFGFSCEEGECKVGPVPVIEVISPEDSVEGELFDLEARVHYRGTGFTAKLELDEGDRCVPFFPRAIVVDGESPQSVVFEDVPSAGARFLYRIDVTTSQVSNDQLVPLEGPERPLGELAVSDPPLVHDAATGYVPLVVESDTPFAEWTVTVRPQFGAPTPTFRVAQQTATIDARVPSARGRQRVEVLTDSGAPCEIATENPDSPEPLGFGLGFISDTGADLDLVVVFEDDAGETTRCTAKSPVACSATGDQGFTTDGFEEVFPEALEGVFGLAVTRAAISDDSPEAFVRVTHDGVHHSFLGPSRLPAQSGNVWLAGRVFVFSGEAFVDLLNVFEDGFPERPPSAW